MSNTIDVYGDELTGAMLVDGTLSEFTDENMTFAGEYAFANCYNLESVDLRNLKTLNGMAFLGCSNLRNVNLPEVTVVGDGIFSGCKNIHTISFPKLVNAAYFAFTYCSNLRSAYFLGSSVPNVANSRFFAETPIYYSDSSGSYGSIYVRASMLESFQSATNWAYYSERMVGLTDEQIAALDNE